LKTYTTFVDRLSDKPDWLEKLE